jgi:hypothetical protein
VKTLIKFAFALAALAVLGYLFAATLTDVSSDPYDVSSADLLEWTVHAEPVGNPNGAALSLRPPRELAMSLFDQVFQRTMESYTTPAVPGIPLVLHEEIAGSPVATSETTLVEMAHAAGLGSARMKPMCMSVYRTLDGREQRRFFVLFDLPQFEQFRLAVQDQLRAGDPDTTFDPGALAPALLIASSDPRQLRALPTPTALEQSCEASVASS